MHLPKRQTHIPRAGSVRQMRRLRRFSSPSSPSQPASFPVPEACPRKRRVCRFPQAFTKQPGIHVAHTRYQAATVIGRFRKTPPARMRALHGPDPAIRCPPSGEGNYRMQKTVPRHRVRGCNFTQTNGGTLWNHTVAEAEGCSLLASRFSVPVTRKPRALWQRHLGRIISPNQSRFLGPPGGCRLTLYVCAACAARGDLRIAFESRALKKVPEMSRRKTKKIKNLLTRNRARRPSPGGGGALISSGKSLFFINNLCHPMDMMTMIWPRRDRCLGLESE